ncbi:cyclic-AMP-mediated signaling protein [Grosmannia clavigera kw1407]|uniref:Cyclic-AMP-mediated signaling protein n=1 Tax=Grosmannia clavigera (strain kw1407 / UAMH 11150) TaxID=655863 RepID=F0XD47_GROCL|nr:cyclic-AMP-mediated signaling protein [Grosmannia clavigera kw1407]EFX04530.1 cyclic-AMP-mediated signaling protein [Grosmannia clavigera kw1407]
MSEQGTSGGVDSTLASGRARAQTETESGPVEPAAEVRSSPAPQNVVVGNFTGGVASQQDPRSSAGTANRAQSPPDAGSATPPMAYQPSQHPSQSTLHPQPISPEQLQEQQKQLQQIAEQQQQNPQIPPQQQHSHREQATQIKSKQRKQHAHQSPSQSRQAQQSSSAAHPDLWHPYHQRQQDAHSQKLEPPVTKATLSELDVGKIIHNPKLRHDINYDPDLHFRPNLDGEKGRRKQEKAQQFWNTLRGELVQFVSNRDEFLKAHDNGEEWSLPALLNAVKDIIQTLVPARDRELLEEGLNVPLLMQQFSRGVVDLEKLAAWLSSVLKLHCAPMRDDWVDEMYKELSRGNRENDMDELVRGLSSLLSVLEAMKLDVANHQIRCLRPLLIEDTVNFEQRFFRKRVENGRMSVSSAEQWYEQAKVDFESPAIRHRQAFGEMATFFTGLCQLLLPSVEAKRVPNTFLFDEERLLKLRSDMLDAIYLEICMKVYDEADGVASSSAAASRFSPAALAVPAYVLQRNSQIGSESWVTSSASVFDFNTPPSSIVPASPTSSRPSSLDFSTFGSTTSSPRNSATPSNCGSTPPHFAADFAEDRLRSRDLYSRLVALLQTATPGVPAAQRWSDLGPKMAVEIYRALSKSRHQQQTSLDRIEQRLEAAMATGSHVQKKVEHTFRGRLLSALARRVRDYKTMPSVGLFVVAAGGRIHPTPGRSTEATPAIVPVAPTTRDVDPREDGGVEEMATRLAHLGILHWRVWGSIVYERQPTEEGDILLV